METLWCLLGLMIYLGIGVGFTIYMDSKNNTSNDGSILVVWVWPIAIVAIGVMAILKLIFRRNKKTQEKIACDVLRKEWEEKKEEDTSE